MKKTVAALVCTIFVFSLVLIPSSDADWNMFRSDLSHDGVGTGNQPLTPTLLWVFNTGSVYIESSPAVVNGVVYIGSNGGNIYALNAAYGTQLWNYTTGNAVWSSPAVANGIIYIGSLDDNIYALNATNGEKMWTYKTGFQVSSSTAVANGVVYVGSDDDNVYALNATTGAQLWNYTTGNGVSSSPAVVNNVVYIGSFDGNVYALNAINGAKLWSYSTDNPIYSSPTVVNDTVYVGTEGGKIYALNAADGTELWSYTTAPASPGYDNDIFSSPAVADVIAYISSDDNNLYALNATSGEKLWINTQGGPIGYSSPAVVDGVVYIGSYEHNVYALNATTGIQIWNYTTGSVIESSPAVVNGVVYVASDDGKVYALGIPPPNSTATTALISVEPATITIGSNVTVTVNIQVDPLPPNSAEFFSNVAVTIQYSNYGSPSSVTNTYSFSPDSDSYSFNYTPSAVANYTFLLNFPGQTFSNGTIYYLPSENHATLTVGSYVEPPLGNEGGQTNLSTVNGITINADGSVTPSTAPIQQASNIYKLTGDVVESITVNRNDVVLDGNGHSITGGEFGVVVSASNVTVANFTITDTGEGVILPGPPVSMGNPTAGIYVAGNSNTITENNLTNNICSIVLLQTSHDLLTENNIIGSSEVAFDLYDSSNNKIYHNNIINNTNNVEDDSFGFGGAMSINIWDDGYPAGGNYWGYRTGNEIGNTGISDKPYQITPSSMVEASSSYQATMNAAYVKNTDRYPLMEPFNASFLLNYAQEMTPPKISVLSPLKEIHSEGNVSLAFSINKEVNWIGYSLDGEQNVTITGNTTLTNMTIGLHTITVFANDTFGEMGASQTISFTIAKPEPFQATTIAVASGTLAVVVLGAGLLVYIKKSSVKNKLFPN